MGACWAVCSMCCDRSTTWAGLSRWLSSEEPLMCRNMRDCWLMQCEGIDPLQVPWDTMLMGLLCYCFFGLCMGPCGNPACASHPAAVKFSWVGVASYMLRPRRSRCMSPPRCWCTPRSCAADLCINWTTWAQQTWTTPLLCWLCWGHMRVSACLGR